MADAPNPLDATYYANLAQLNFQKENTLAQNKRGREQTNANSAYSKGQLTRQEPLKLQGNRNTANSQGLLESGQLAQRQGQTQTDYATKQNRIGEQRRSAIERFNESDQNAGKGYLLGAQKAEAESFQRSKEALLANPPVPAQEANGGVVAKTSQQGRNWYRVGQPLKPFPNNGPNPGSIRQRAASKATRQGVG